MVVFKFSNNISRLRRMNKFSIKNGRNSLGHKKFCNCYNKYIEKVQQNTLFNIIYDDIIHDHIL